MSIQETTTNPFAAQVLDFLSDPIIWVQPVLNDLGEATDFRVCYSNRAADEGIQHPKGSLTGLCIREDGVPSRESAEGNFRHFFDVYTSGEVKEFTFFAHHSNRQYETIRRPFKGGVLSTTRDRRAQREAERREQEKAELLNGIVQHAPVGIVVYKAVRNQANEVLDFEVKLFNDVLHQVTGISREERSRLSFRQLLETLASGDVFDRYKALVENGSPFAFEYFSPRVERWLNISVVRLGDGFLIMISDIHPIKISQQKLQQQSSYLTSILNTSLNAVATMEAVRDGSGAIVDLKYQQVNKRFLEWLSKNEQEVLGKTMLTLLPATAAAGLFNVYRKVIETGIPQHTEVSYSEGDSTIWYDLSVARLDENSAVGTFNDITQRKNAHEEVNRQKLLLDNLLRYSPSGITVIEAVRNEEGRMIDVRHLLVNEQAEKFIGFSRQQLLSHTNSQLDPNFADSQLLKELATTLQTGETAFSSYQMPNGQWIEGAASKMDADRLICVFSDVTAAKEAQAQMESLLEQLRRSNKNLEEFAYAASHDLQEPLRKIHTFSDRLRESLAHQLSAEQQAMFARIEAATRRMRNLIDDLLSYSQVSTGPEVYETVNLNSVLDQVVSDLEASVTATGAHITINRLPQVKGDERQLRQLFQNLVSNAIKYRKQHLPPEISISSQSVNERSSELERFPAAERGNYHLIEVSDNGIGFDQQEVDKIFQVFQRLHGRGEYEGTGVGLAIAQKVVQNHRGYITARSEPDQGAVFQVLLPVN